MIESEKLNKLFYNIEIPETPIVLDETTTIMNPSLFIKSHISYIENNLTNSRFQPYLDRLLKLKKILENGRQIP